MERLDFTNESSYNATECAIHLNRYLAAKPYVAGKRVLDIACGEGYGSKLLKDWGASSVVGVDISEEALKVANKLFTEDGITFLNHTAEELPFEPDSFDVVVSFETVEHLDHPDRFLMEISRVVKFNGTVLISCPNDNYYARNDEAFANPFHKQRYSWFDFKELTEQYLGEGEKWFFGFALKGFSTIPLTATREPENENLPEQMTDLLSYTEPKITAFLQAERYLNHWNACYYVGIWGTNVDDEFNSTASFPAEFLSPADNPAKEELARWKLSYLREKEETEKRIAALEDEHQQKVRELEQRLAFPEQGTEDICEHGEAECVDDSVVIEELRAELADKEKRISELEFLLEKKEALVYAGRIERERTSNLLKVAETEKGCLWGRIGGFEETIRQRDEQIRDRDEQIREKDFLLNSKAMRFVFWFWRVRDKIFGRK